MWNNPERAQELGRERAKLKADLEQLDTAGSELSNASELLELAEAEDDAAAVADIEKEIPQLESKVRQLEFRRMFRGEMDAHSAYLDIQAGAGGTEAQDWAQMLMRMYLRWGARRGFGTEVMDSQGGRSRRHQELHDCLRGRVRLRLAAHRDRRAPAGAQEPLRFGQPPPHLVRFRIHLAADRR